MGWSQHSETATFCDCPFVIAVPVCTLTPVPPHMLFACWLLFIFVVVVSVCTYDPSATPCFIVCFFVVVVVYLCFRRCSGHSDPPPPQLFIICSECIGCLLASRCQNCALCSVVAIAPAGLVICAPVIRSQLAVLSQQWQRCTTGIRTTAYPQLLGDCLTLMECITLVRECSGVLERE